MTTTRYPSASRALAQLDRHGSGTPNDVPAAPLPLAESMARAAASIGVSGAQMGGRIAAWQESMRSNREAT